MKIAVVGTGYVGLVSGSCLADFGHQVICIDKESKRIAALLEGKIPFFEPGLEQLVKTNVERGRLSFSVQCDEAVRRAEAVFIAVGTPACERDGDVDLSQIHEAACDLAGALRGFQVVVMKSTVPVGTCDEIEAIIKRANPAADFSLVSNPEFLREGNAIHDFKHPDRIIIGTQDGRVKKIMDEIYQTISLNSVPVIYTDRKNAELIKYASNAFLATKVAFINEIADLCEKIGADVQEIARGIGFDSRIGPRFLNAGPGYGGSCFPKDTMALIKTAQDHGAPLRIVEAVAACNEQRKRGMLRKIAAALGGKLPGKTVAVLGLTFKPNTDDVRNAPSLSLIAALQEQGARIRAYDPAGMNNAKCLLRNVIFCEDPYHCADSADVVVIVTEWEQFRMLDLDRLQAVIGQPLMVDLRNIYRIADVQRRGFTYYSVGRPAVLASPMRRSLDIRRAVPGRVAARSRVAVQTPSLGEARS
jgi:UDPglucose 6-dehydrogenase